MLGSLTAYAGGEWASKLWSLKPSLFMAAIVAATSTVSISCWLPALRMHGQLSALSAIWASGALIIGVLVGVLGFHEQLSSQQLIGVFLALLAIFMVY